MKRALLAVALLAGGCFRVIHEHDCDAGVVPPIIPPPAHAQLLFVLDLQRGGANLIAPLSVALTRLQGELAAGDVIVDQFAVLPLYGGIDGTPRLVYGYPSMTNGDPTAALIAATQSGNYDAPLPNVTAEQYNLTLAAQLDVATLPPEQTNGNGAPFFATPVDEFIVVLVQPTARLCALTDPKCAIAGQSPVDWFSATASDGTAAWIKVPGGSYLPKRTYQVFLTTSEGESPADFADRCSKVPGFPVGLLDVMAPSPVKYYTDLATGLQQKGWHAEQIDLCAAFGAAQPSLFEALGKRIGLAAHQ